MENTLIGGAIGLATAGLVAAWASVRTQRARLQEAAVRLWQLGNQCTRVAWHEFHSTSDEVDRLISEMLQALVLIQASVGAAMWWRWKRRKEIESDVGDLLARLAAIEQARLRGRPLYDQLANPATLSADAMGILEMVIPASSPSRELITTYLDPVKGARRLADRDRKP